MKHNRVGMFLSAIALLGTLNLLALDASSSSSALTPDEEASLIAGDRGACNRSRYCGGCISTTQCAPTTIILTLPNPPFFVSTKICVPLNGKNGCANDITAKKCNPICVLQTCDNDKRDCGRLKWTGCSSYVPNPAQGEPSCPPVPCYWTDADCANCG